MILSIKNLSVNYGLIPAIRNLSMEVVMSQAYKELLLVIESLEK